MPNALVCKPRPLPGVLVVLFLVFLVFQEVELTVPVKVPSVTCAVEVACSTPLAFGEDGTERSLSDIVAMQWLPQWLPPL
jgi:hypothetical protein